MEPFFFPPAHTKVSKAVFPSEAARLPLPFFFFPTCGKHRAASPFPASWWKKVVFPFFFFSKDDRGLTPFPPPLHASPTWSPLFSTRPRAEVCTAFLFPPFFCLPISERRSARLFFLFFSLILNQHGRRRWFSPPVGKWLGKRSAFLFLSAKPRLFFFFARRKVHACVFPPSLSESRPAWPFSSLFFPNRRDSAGPLPPKD